MDNNEKKENPKIKKYLIEDTNKIWKKITYINFVLALLVLMLHARFNMYVTNEGTGIINEVLYNINKFIQVLADCAVPTFFCISSMLFFRKFEMNQYEEKITKRIKSLLIPYLFFSIFFLIIYIIIQQIPVLCEIIWNPIKSLSIKDLVKYIIYANADSALWFVRVLLIWFAISPIVYYFIKRLRRISLIVILGTIIFNLMNVSNYSSLINWLPVLILGAYLGINHWEQMKEVPLIKKHTKIVSIIFLIFFIMIIIYVMGRGNKTYYIYRMISPVFIWIIFDMFKYRKEPKWWLKISFFIFCMHYPIVIAQRNLLVHFFGKQPITLVWMYIVSIVVALLIIYIIAIILRKYFNKLWNLITGSRS